MPRKIMILAAISFATPGLAQAPSGQTLGGPRVAGVCLLSQQAVVANSKVGKAATARLQQLAQQAQGEVNGARAPIEADAKSLDAQRATLKPNDYDAKRAALAQRLQSLEQTAQNRSRQVELTRQNALGQIAQQVQPIIATVYKTRGCGLLMDRSAVLGGNMDGDLTAEVMQALDAKVSTINFDLAPLPAQPAKAGK
jgi:Skp family chaperone for outer membrane proteins